MMNRQSGLGRGLGALIPQKPAAASGGDRVGVANESVDAGERVQQLPIDRVDPNPHQPRRHFDHGELDELVGSIKEHGVLQPIIVTTKADGRYELIAGERRLRASKIAGRETVPALVLDATEQQKTELALIENIQRADLNALEEARAYLVLQEEFGLTQEDVARRVGKSRSQIANTIRLLQLPDVIQVALVDKKIFPSHARTLLALPTEEERMKMFAALLEGQLTVRQTEARVIHRPRKISIEDANIVELERKLRETLGVRVHIRRDVRGEGEIRIPFFNDEDLQNLITKITGSP